MRRILGSRRPCRDGGSLRPALADKPEVDQRHPRDGNTIDDDGCSSRCQNEGITLPVDLDGDVDLEDYAVFMSMFRGPAVSG